MGAELHFRTERNQKIINKVNIKLNFDSLNYSVVTTIYRQRKRFNMIEITIIVMGAAYVAGIYVGKHWDEFTKE